MTKNPKSTASWETKQTRRSGWDSRARAYHKYQGKVSAQAVGPLLDAVGIAAGGASAGQRVLDVATGPGYAAGEAARRGARVMGLDFAPAMVALASRNFPEVAFLEGDGDHLPFADDAFDAVICCFGMPQMALPERVIAEAYRVLSPGGRYGFTLRAGKARDPNKQMVYAAVQAHGEADVALPPAGSDSGLRDPAKYEALLAAAGFTGIEISEVPVVWRPQTEQEILDTVYNGSRSSRLLERETPQAREKIDRAILEFAARFKVVEGFKIPRLALLLAARKS
ncbi:MAG: class I SAM-dependent methyltransferase [Alphaproteobacteria bacterium]